MSDPSARSRWRDALVLTVLAIVISSGLVHYGRGLGHDDDPPRAAHHGVSKGPSPTGDPTAQLEGAPPSDPAEPAVPAGGTCWDGRETSSLRLCGLPDGARGLSWVFPSFERDRELCHRARPNRDSYPVVESYVCFERAMGRPVTITYDQVEDPAQVERWLVTRIGTEHRTEIPGAHGGRSIFRDAVSRPARITGMYERFPYVVSVYAATPEVATHAWRELVRQRPSGHIRGVRH